MIRHGENLVRVEHRGVIAWHHRILCQKETSLESHVEPYRGGYLVCIVGTRPRRSPSSQAASVVLEGRPSILNIGSEYCLGWDLNISDHSTRKNR